MFHLEKPQNFTSKLQGSICFVECKEEFLCLKRSPNSSQGNTWTAAPGGKLEPGESALQAAVREVQEETGIQLLPSKLQFLHTVYFQYSDREYILHLFYASIPQKLPITLMDEEHTEYVWASFEKMLALPLMEGDKECIDFVRNRIR